MAVSFADWLQQLREKRQRWVDASHENDFDRGIWNATVEKYADATHFIFELLQNAEDVGATSATFSLEPNAIVFEHNGRPFDRDDIEGITGIGNTTKLEEANKIGCFGIGFKSVYVVTQRPEIHCTIEGSPIAFGIRDLVVPEIIETSHRAPTTRIVLPLPQQEAAQRLDKVNKALEASGPRSLLFLQSLTRLEWTDGTNAAECLVRDEANGVRTIRTTTLTKPTTEDRFVILSRPVPRENDVRVYSVKIAFRLNDAGDVIPETSTTRLAVFFETEDNTGLHFQLHGPFQLTDNRANVKRGDKWNTKLIAELSALLADSLVDIRNRGFIKRSFFEVLPNDSDDIPEPWTSIRTAAINAFRELPLIPIHSGGFLPASQAVRGPSDIRDLLGDEGLGLFGGLIGRKWTIGVLRNSRADAFLSSVKIPSFGPSEFISAFEKTFPPINSTISAEVIKAATDWFDRLDDDQVQRFYLLIDASFRNQRRSVLFAYMRFVRLEDGTRARPGDAFLTPIDAPLDEEASGHGFAFVRAGLIRSDRPRGKEVEQFLKRIGVREVGEQDYLKVIAQANYSLGAKTPTIERHLQHMRRFLRWNAEHGDVEALNGLAFLRVEGIEGYHKPWSVFIGPPYAENNLAIVYDGSVKGRNRLPLWGGYLKLKRTDLLSFALKVGVEDGLKIEKTRVRHTHPQFTQLRYGFGQARVTSTETNLDFRIEQLPELLARRNPDISRLVWKSVSGAGSHVMQAQYAPNSAHDAHRAPSTLASQLRDANWIPTKDGSMKRPSAVTTPDLAEGLVTTGNEAWLNAIGFGADHRERSEKHLANRKAARAIGLPEELADQLASLSPDALKIFGSEMLRQIASGAFAAPLFPEHEVPNPERRAERLAERARTSPVKAYEARNRSVRVTDKESRQLSRPYLRSLYTNVTGEMICQACHTVMPFNLEDGTPYFEVPELLQSASSEVEENHLALCPNCCAKWQHARNTKDVEILENIRSSACPELQVTLAGSLTRIRFVRSHFDDLRTVFAVVGLDPSSSEAAA